MKYQTLNLLRLWSLPRTGLRLLSYILFLIFYVANASAFPINRDSLDNGLILLTTEDHKLPMVDIVAVVKAGSIYDPKGKEGLANLVANLLIRGTKTKTREAINETIEFVGGQLRSSASYDYTQLSIRILSKDLDLALDLLSDFLQNSVFSDSEVMKTKKEVRSGIKRFEDEPDEVGLKEFRRLLFQGHPYGNPISGYDSTVSEIRPQEIKEFYNNYYCPNNTFLIAVGDFNPQELKAKIAQRFLNWQPRPVPEITITEPQPFTKPKVKIITKKDINQSYIFLGHLGIQENHPEVFPIRVMNFILGGSALSSRLGEKVREQQGLAYDVRSGFERNLLRGAFIAETQTKTDNTQIAINTILKEIRDMKLAGATQDELSRAKKYYTGNFPLTIDSFTDKLGLLLRIERYRLGLDYLDKFNEKVNKVTLEEIKSAANKYLDPDHYLLVIVSNLTKENISLGEVEWIE